MQNKTVTENRIALDLAHFAATGVAVIAAALHRGQPIDDRTIKHLQSLLEMGAKQRPQVAQEYFDAISATLAGAHHEDRRTSD